MFGRDCLVDKKKQTNIYFQQWSLLCMWIWNARSWQ